MLYRHGRRFLLRQIWRANECWDDGGPVGVRRSRLFRAKASVCVLLGLRRSLFADGFTISVQSWGYSPNGYDFGSSWTELVVAKEWWRWRFDVFGNGS